MRKIIAVIAGIIVLTIVIVSMIIFRSDEDTDLNLSNTVIMSSITYGEDRWEVYDQLDGNNIIVLKNGELQFTKVFTGDITTQLGLPTVETSKEAQFNEQITHNTYKNNIVSSIEHVNYLKESGYEVYFSALTPDFYELYLKKPSMINFKRLIITKDYIVDFNTEAINFDINDYIK